MRQLPIRFAQLTRSTAILKPEGYRFFKPKKYGWLARLLWRGLEKLHALEQYTTLIETYSYTQQNQEDLTKAIMGHIDYLLRDGCKIEDYAFIVGGETYYELTNTMLRNSANVMRFPAGNIRFNNYDDEGTRYVYEFRGIPVHVVPNMSGIAAVPKVLIEKKKDEKRDFELIARELPPDPNFIPRAKW